MRRALVVVIALLCSCGSNEDLASEGCGDFTTLLAASVTLTDTQVRWQMTFPDLRDAYTFNLTGLPRGTLEYRWRVLTFVDEADAEPPLEASVSNVVSGDEVRAAIGAVTQNVFSAPPEHSETLGVEVDTAADTLTLVAERAWDARLERLSAASLFRYSTHHDNMFEVCADELDGRL